jgi:hypothetical protein
MGKLSSSQNVTICVSFPFYSKKGRNGRVLVF